MLLLTLVGRGGCHTEYVGPSYSVLSISLAEKGICRFVFEPFGFSLWTICMTGHENV